MPTEVVDGSIQITAEGQCFRFPEDLPRMSQALTEQQLQASRFHIELSVDTTYASYAYCLSTSSADTPYGYVLRGEVFSTIL